MREEFATRINVKAGTDLFQEGDEGGTGYFIESGTLDVWVFRRGQKVVLTTCGEGELVGELSAIDGAPRSACVTTLTDCVLYKFTHKQIEQKFRQTNPLLSMFLRSMADRIRATNAKITAAFETSNLRTYVKPNLEIISNECQSDFKLEADLRNALANEEFELYFQPIIELSTMKLAGFESLIRWNHPEIGLIPPDNFIPYAEESGFISQISRWCVQSAWAAAPILRQAALKNIQQVKPLFVTVNLSGKDTGSQNFADWIVNYLKKSVYQPGMLKVELTESCLLENYTIASSMLHDLRSIGVDVAIDDFGTGQSNLASLIDLPLSVLKIDRSFISGKLNIDNNRKVVKLILGLADQMGVDVVCEGIEDNNDLNPLRELRGGFGQGYMFAKPLPLDKAVDFVKQWQGSTNFAQQPSHVLAHQ